MKTIIYKSPKLPGIQEKLVPNDELGVLKKFEETLKDTSFDLRIFYENCKSLKIKASDNLGDNLFFVNNGEYDLLHNRLYYNLHNPIGIFHELFHMASNIVGRKVIYNGFCQYSAYKKRFFGEGLDETYTSILDLRYFNNPEKEEVYENSYNSTRSLVELLELLLGREKIEKWYSQADLQSLIKELGQYFGNDIAIKFINALDVILHNADCRQVGNPLAITMNYRFALTFLGRCFMKKYALNYYLNDDDVMAYLEKIDEVREMMDKRIVCPAPFKIIKSRKYTDKRFEHDFEIIERKIIKKYS